jgi:shikimate dehydrogenase
MLLTGSTNITGIFGHPVKHTLSPMMHNAAFEALGLDYAYTAFDVKPEGLKSAVNSIRVLGIKGVNVTIPHKEKVMAYLDKVDPLAKKIGSVNTIVNTGGCLSGFNTDGPGFIADLKKHGFNPKNKNVILAGAGGAGRAIAVMLSLNGAKKIYITDTDEKKAKLLVSHVPRAGYLSARMWKNGIKNADILINATPAGMAAGGDPLVEKHFLRKNLFIYDIVYNRTTKLLKYAAEIGAKNCSGIGMLLNQGALAFELFTGKTAPKEVMRKALLKELKRSKLEA